MTDERLSENFTLGEFTFSQTATREGIDNQVPPGSDAHKNIMRLCALVLQPLRYVTAPVTISSGYRSPALNTRINGSKRSQHCHGQAADILVRDMTPMEVCRWIKDSGLPFDQLIHEFGRWTHVSIAAEGDAPRRQVLTATRAASGKTEYREGLHAVD